MSCLTVAVAAGGFSAHRCVFNCLCFFACALPDEWLDLVRLEIGNAKRQLSRSGTAARLRPHRREQYVRHPTGHRRSHRHRMDRPE